MPQPAPDTPYAILKRCPAGPRRSFAVWAWADTASAVDNAACSSDVRLPGVNILMVGMQESTRLADTVAQSPDTLRADCRAPADFCALQYTAEIFDGDCRHDSLPRASMTRMISWESKRRQAGILPTEPSKRYITWDSAWSAQHHCSVCTCVKTPLR